MTNLFIDTNIIIDVLANRKPYSESAAQLFDLAERGKIHLMISALSYSNIFYILKKNCTHRELISLLKDIESLTETLAVTKDVIAKSLTSEFKDLEDSIQYHTALAHKKVSAIITRNVKDYKGSKINVLTPDEAVSAIAS